MNIEYLHPKGQKVLTTRNQVLDRVLENREAISYIDKYYFLNPEDPLRISLERSGIKKERMKEAIGLIEHSIHNEETICIYGDYDVDGVSSAAIIYKALKIRDAKVKVFIPNRFEDGYGFTVEGVNKILSQQDDLAMGGNNKGLFLIFDSGVSPDFQKAIEYVHENNIKTAAFDHHEADKVKPPPDHDALVHTTELCSAGISWFTARELLHKEDMGELLGLAALATIADVEELKNVNRLITYHGLKMLQTIHYPGLLAVYDKANIKSMRNLHYFDIDTYKVSMNVAPRFNSAGRYGEAEIAFKCLTTNDQNEAEVFAKHLNNRNSERRHLQEEQSFQALEMVAKEGLEKNLFILLVNKEFHEGIVGLIASDIIKKHYLPTIVLTIDQKGFARGSGRSIRNFSILEAMKSAGDIYHRMGGHEKAGGLTIKPENLDMLYERLKEYTQNKFQNVRPIYKYRIDAAIPLKLVDLELYQDMQKLEPFGIGSEYNQRPIFISRDIKVVSAGVMGKEKNDLWLQLRDGNAGRSTKAVYFRHGELAAIMKKQPLISLAYEIKYDNYQKQRNEERPEEDKSVPLELMVKDLDIQT